MKGHIKQRGPNTWAIVIPDGTKRRWFTYHGNKRGAQVECARLIGEVQSGAVSAAPARLSTGAFLTRWLEHIRSQVSPGSLQRYGSIIRAISPLIGHTPLAKLQPLDISTALAKLQEGGLSRATVKLTFKALRQALKQGQRWNLVGRNATDGLDAPRVEKRRMVVLDDSQTARLLEMVRGSELFAPVLIAIMTGARRGEILALRWRDVTGSTVSITASVEQTMQGIREKPPKNGRGRSVHAPALLIEELRQHRIRQAEALLALGIRLTDDSHICVRSDGSQMEPIWVTKTFGDFIAGSGLPRIRFHDLRHGFASHLLGSNTHAKVVSEMLGHSSIGVTMDIYGHIAPTLQSDAAAKVDSTMRAALAKIR